MIPWGNAYFNTSACGRAEYDRDQLDCYRHMCAGDSAAPDCFTAAAICQHGPAECFGNRMQSCVLQMRNFPDWMPFMVCYGEHGNLSAVKAQECAHACGLNFSKLETCVQGDSGEQIDVSNAKATLAFTGAWGGTPTVTVAGQAVVDPDVGSNLQNAICEAYRAICDNSEDGCNIKYCSTLNVIPEAGGNVHTNALSIPLGILLLCVALLGTAFTLQRLNGPEESLHDGSL